MLCSAAFHVTTLPHAEGLPLVLEDIAGGPAFLVCHFTATPAKAGGGAAPSRAEGVDFIFVLVSTRLNLLQYFLRT